MDCKTCKENRAEVAYIVYESAMARAERHIKRLIIALVTAVLLLAATNLAWLYAWTRYDYVSYDQDGRGINIIGDTNEVSQYEPEIPVTDEEER